MNKKFAWFKNFSILITFSTNLSSETSSLIQIPRNNNLFVLQLISKYLPENPIIIEAGAFNGSDSLVMSNFWPKGTIYAFEPAPELYQLIVKRIKDKSNIFAFEYALSDKNGIANFYLSAKTNSPKHTSSSCCATLVLSSPRFSRACRWCHLKQPRQVVKPASS